MNLHAFSVLGFSYGTLLIAVLALAKRRDEAGIRFFIFCLVVCGWSFLFSFWITQNYSPEYTLFLIRVSYVFVMFIPITWTHFLFDFLGKREPFKYFYVFNYIAAGLLALSCPTSLMFSGLHKLEHFRYLPTPGLLHHVHMLFYAGLVPYGFYYLIREAMRSSGDRRIQLWALILGTLCGFSAGTANYLTFYKIPAPLELHLLMPLYPFLTGIALIRYGLFDPQEIADTFRRDKLAAIGILSAGINHEIRNPLYVIQGLGQAHLTNIQEKVYAGESEHCRKADEVIQKTVHQAERAMDIMKRFSLFAKRGVDEAMQVQPTVIEDALNNVLPLIRFELELDFIQFISHIPKNLPLVRLDPRHLEEIFFNLIVNACQAIKGGSRSGKIEIEASRQEDRIKITIADNGPGIDENHLAHLFTPFYTTKPGGSGLGLYIVKQLVQKNKGDLTVSSSSSGTTLALEFPRV